MSWRDWRTLWHSALVLGGISLSLLVIDFSSQWQPEPLLGSRCREVVDASEPLIHINESRNLKLGCRTRLLLWFQVKEDNQEIIRKYRQQDVTVSLHFKHMRHNFSFVFIPVVNTTIWLAWRAASLKLGKIGVIKNIIRQRSTVSHRIQKRRMELGRF